MGGSALSLSVGKRATEKNVFYIVGRAICANGIFAVKSNREPIFSHGVGIRDMLE